MAAIAFDTLTYARKLKAAGIPQAQAEAQAEIMADAFQVNVESLVTKDYLDARLGEWGIKVEDRFTRLEHRINEHQVRNDIQFARIDGRFMLMFWMLSLIVVTTIVPAVVKLLS